MSGLVIKGGFISIGLLLIVVSFLMHSYKKITVNYTVIWSLLGIALIMTGLIPALSAWTRLLATGTGIAFAVVGAIFLFEVFRTSVQISDLLLKTREMAMQLSMLNQENEILMKEIERLSRMVEDGDQDEDEKKEDLVCS